MSAPGPVTLAEAGEAARRLRARWPQCRATPWQRTRLEWGVQVRDGRASLTGATEQAAADWLAAREAPGAEAAAGGLRAGAGLPVG